MDLEALLRSELEPFLSVDGTVGLKARLFVDLDAIIDGRCDAWNRFTAEPNRIASLSATFGAGGPAVYAACRTRARSKSCMVRPSICRLISFSLMIGLRSVRCSRALAAPA